MDLIFLCIKREFSLLIKVKLKPIVLLIMFNYKLVNILLASDS